MEGAIFSFGLWCNGNTTDSGPVFLGSNPSSPTSFKHLPLRVDAFCCIWIPYSLRQKPPCSLFIGYYNHVNNSLSLSTVFRFLIILCFVIRASIFALTFLKTFSVLLYSGSINSSVSDIILTTSRIELNASSLFLLLNFHTICSISSLSFHINVMKQGKSFDSFNEKTLRNSLFSLGSFQIGTNI